ncbi:MAG: type II toxin-antitoxin system prevent-host-death family antitoxin [Deltaproteobacteria bacterium]|nr:type II toxin-antitoxin system prevent-host-death family antitoxin [Deltaproteobacteria bacterium]
MKEAYSIYEAKTHFSKLVRGVKGGKVITIKERGVPVGLLVPFKTRENFNKRLERLALQGRLLPAKRNGIPAGVKREGALRRFLEERD